MCCIVAAVLSLEKQMEMFPTTEAQEVIPNYSLPSGNKNKKTAGSAINKLNEPINKPDMFMY